MVLRRSTCVLAMVASVAAVPLAAQRGVVRGVVFDSLRGRPLGNAFVTVAGSEKGATTDGRGRFEFPALNAGRHTFVAQHPLLDSIGLSGLRAHVTINGVDDNEIRLATPSFETLWKAACSGRPPRDSGIVFGTIRDAARGSPAAKATVELSWAELFLSRRRSVTQRQSRIATETNMEGGYAVCGVPPEVAIRVHANLDSIETGALDLPPLTSRVQRRDLLIGRTTSSDPADRGNVNGVVATPSGTPWVGARISTPGLEEVHTDTDGRFRLNGVAIGTRQIAVYAIGASPTFVPVDVLPNSDGTVVIHVEKVPMLGGTTVTATNAVRIAAMEFTERKRAGLGYIRDSTALAQFDEFPNVLREVPGLNVRFSGTALTVTVSDGKGGMCVPDVVIDGAPGGVPHLIDLTPREIAGVEIYARLTQVPARFQRPGIRSQCGMIIVWTKYGFRNR